MPGLDEELFFRGLLLALFLRAFGDHWNLAGAPVGPAAIAVSFLFAAGHALRFGNGSLGFDPAFLMFSAILGFGLLWLRQRTGSIALPIVAHNIINFGSSFL
jgi:membrane protease YdiL (CAAX protease family)